MEKKGVKGCKRGVKHAITVSGVSSIVAYLPLFRALKARYRIKDLSIYLLLLLAHNGAMRLHSLCVGYYGNKDGNKWRYTCEALMAMRDNGLVGNAGGKWHLTEKGMRELGLID